MQGSRGTSSRKWGERVGEGKSLEVRDEEGGDGELLVPTGEPQLVAAIPSQWVEVGEEGGLLHVLPQEGGQGGESRFVPWTGVSCSAHFKAIKSASVVYDVCEEWSVFLSFLLLPSTITISGFNLVAHNCEGMVPPPGAFQPGKSLYTLNLDWSKLLTMKLIRLLCRHVYLSVMSITEQQFMMWFVVPLLPHSLHLSEAPYIQRFRLAGVGRVSMDVFNVNLSVPDLSWNMLDFKIRSTFSFTARARRLPCNCKLSAWVVRLSWILMIVWLLLSFILQIISSFCSILPDLVMYMLIKINLSIHKKKIGWKFWCTTVAKRLKKHMSFMERSNSLYPAHGSTW